MRVFTTRVNLLLDWIASNPEPAIARRVSKALASEAVFAGDVTRREIKKAIQNLGTCDASQILEALSDAIPIARGDGGVREEKLIASIESETLPSLLDHENWHSALEKHTSSITSNENRDEAFGRIIGHLVSAPIGRIEIIDQFLSHKILKKEPVFGWFLEKLSARNVTELVIHTSFPQGEFDARQIPRNQRLNTLVEYAAGLAEAHKFKGKIRINIYVNNLHDRYWKVDFSEGSMAFTNGHGLDVFKKERINGAGPFYQVKNNDWHQRLVDLNGPNALISKLNPDGVPQTIEVWTSQAFAD